MKLSKLFVLGTVALSALAAGCSNENTAQPEVEAGAGDLKITLVGDNYGRATGPSSYAEESAVKKFSVYVFNAENNSLEDSQTFTNVTTGTMSGLSTGFPKKVVVLTNTPTNFPSFVEGDDYDKFASVAAAINLDYQTTANIGTNGMVMYGETQNDVTLNPLTSTSLTIQVRRVAAKVSLGSIRLLPTGNYKIEDFKITGVSIQRAVSATNIYGGSPYSTPTLYGGLVGSMSLTQKSYLYDAISQDFVSGTIYPMTNYFYVLPNESRENATLLTLISTYEGDEQYFPIPINFNEGDQNTDGTLIMSNKHYVINLVVNNLGEGTTDPDLPPTTSSIDVTVEVVPWDVDIIQNVVW